MTASFWGVVLLFAAVIIIAAAPPPPWTRWVAFGLALFGLILWCLRGATI